MIKIKTDLFPNTFPELNGFRLPLMKRKVQFIHEIRSYFSYFIKEKFDGSLQGFSLEVFL